MGFGVLCFFSHFGKSLFCTGFFAFPLPPRNFFRVPSRNFFLDRSLHLSTPFSILISILQSLEANYHTVETKFGKLSQVEALESLTNGKIDFKSDPVKLKALSDGLFCGILVDAENANKVLFTKDNIFPTVLFF